MKFLLAIMILFFNQASLFSQIEGLIVEKYYISDAIDETDTIGGVLKAGSTTFRVYLDLKEGSKLRKIYGDKNHPFIIKSKNSFWNNKSDGQTFAYNFSKVRYSENTVALDSWLTLGQTTRAGGLTQFGILKSDDTNGSFIGGINNDGGSAEIPSGLLTNNDPDAKIALTISDGMATMSQTPNNWASIGFIDATTGEDTTIFGSERNSNLFYSTEASLQNSGVSGVLPEKNQVLIAQLTTFGEQLSYEDELYLELNVELEIKDSTGGTRIIKYVANDKVILDDEEFVPELKYPAVCGCQDLNYLEARKKYACHNPDSCKTLIVFGCLDSLACNYNSMANYNIQSLCCYVGLCGDRDLNLVCPNLSIRARKDLFNLEIYPTIANDEIHLIGSSIYPENLTYQIYDLNGRLVQSDHLVNGVMEIVNISGFKNGVYLLRSYTDDFYKDRIFIKQ